MRQNTYADMLNFFSLFKESPMSRRNAAIASIKGLMEEARTQIQRIEGIYSSPANAIRERLEKRLTEMKETLDELQDIPDSEEN